MEVWEIWEKKSFFMQKKKGFRMIEEQPPFPKKKQKGESSELPDPEKGKREDGGKTAKNLYQAESDKKDQRNHSEGTRDRKCHRYGRAAPYSTLGGRGKKQIPRDQDNTKKEEAFKSTPIHRNREHRIRKQRQ